MNRPSTWTEIRIIIQNWLTDLKLEKPQPAARWYSREKTEFKLEQHIINWNFLKTHYVYAVWIKYIKGMNACSFAYMHIFPPPHNNQTYILTHGHARTHFHTQTFVDICACTYLNSLRRTQTRVYWPPPTPPTHPITLKMQCLGQADLHF